MKIHLYYQPKKTNTGVVGYYSLAASIKEDGKFKKKIIHRIGRLTEFEADSYRTLLKGLNEPSKAVGLCPISEIGFKDEKRYFDVLILNALWEKLDLESLFSSNSGIREKLTTDQVARILTFNRLLAPTSKIRTIPWLKKTLLPKILGINFEDYRKTKIFTELDKIHFNKPQIEKHFAAFSKKQKSPGYKVYYFDGSTSWFEGSQCPLSKADIEKTRGYYPKVVSLMMVTDDFGYPIAWDALDGHAKDTSCFKEISKRIYDNYGIKEITYCFDRGVASESNFRAIANCRAKFISAIRDNQIKTVFNLEKFEVIRSKILDSLVDVIPKEKRRIIDIDGFFTHDRNIFFKDLGIIKGMRYVASFNVELYTTESQLRTKKLHDCLTEISNKNLELSHAKGDRAFNVTERDLLEILSRFNMRDVIEYTLLPITPNKMVQSFQIECSLKQQKLQELGMTDGLLLYITDHVEKNEYDRFNLHASQIIAHYKNKYVIENSFRELKSFLDLRPFHVWTEAHVKAHYDIAVIAYFINNYILKCLDERNQENEDDLSLRDFYNLLKEAGTAVQLVAPNGVEIFKMKKIPKDLVGVLQRLGLSKLSRQHSNTSHGVYL